MAVGPISSNMFVRVLSYLNLFVISGFAHAEPPDVVRQETMTVEKQQVHPGFDLEWDNQNPHQRQALDSFYQSLQSLNIQQPVDQQLRQQQLDQLRDMPPPRRPEEFQDFLPEQTVPESASSSSAP